MLGPVGSGKSTLVDYYLRCYCGTKGRNRAEFDKKLIVHFDSKVIQDNTDFYHDFFLFAQSSIRYQCSQKGFEIDLAIKRRPTQPNNVREWVWAALEELTRIAEKKDPAAPFHHIVLVVDNLDQTPPAVQIRAITEVEQWLLTPSIKLWRVFLPLWPSTYNSLRNHRFNLLRGANVFRIGSIDRDILIDNYDRAAIESTERVELVARAPGGRVPERNHPARQGSDLAADRAAGARQPSADALALGRLPAQRGRVQHLAARSSRSRARDEATTTNCSTP